MYILLQETVFATKPITEPITEHISQKNPPTLDTANKSVR